MTLQDLQYKCIELVARALNCSPATLTNEDHLYGHPSWDSLGQLQIIVELERAFQVSIPNESIEELTTMRGIISACEEWSDTRQVMS